MRGHEHSALVRDHRDPGWWWAHNAIILQYGSVIGPYGISVYAALACLANNETQTTRTLVGRIAELTSMSARQVARVLKHLMDLRLIDVGTQRAADGSQAANEYRLLKIPPTPLRQEDMAADDGRQGDCQSGGDDSQSIQGDCQSGGGDCQSVTLKERASTEDFFKQDFSYKTKQGDCESTSAFPPALYVTKRKRHLTGFLLAGFQEFLATFGFGRGKAEAADAYLDLAWSPQLRKTNTPTPDDEALQQKILIAARREHEARRERLRRNPEAKFKWPQGWLSGRRFEDDPDASGDLTTRRDVNAGWEGYETGWWTLPTQEEGR